MRNSMRYLFVVSLLCAACGAQTTQVASDQNWQKPTLVTLHFREVSAQQALDAVSEQTGVNFR